MSLIKKEHQIDNCRFKCIYCGKTYKSIDCIPYHTHKNAYRHEMFQNLNFVNCSTRISKYKNLVTGVVRTSTSSLDNVLQNSVLIQEIINVVHLVIINFEI